MALVVDNSEPTSLIDVSKQATKALKCVASTSKQVRDILARKHERIIKRICSISEEVQSLKGDVMENIAHQRERRQQLSEIEEDIEQAQLLGNGTMVEELMEELRVVKDETHREDSLYRALCKTVRSRKSALKQFMKERAAVEEEIRGFECKQKLIQTLLATCSKQSSSSVDTQGSSASSQSDCGASALEDSGEEEGSNSTDSDSPGQSTAQSSREKWLAKSVSLDATSPSPVKSKLRVRSLSSDCTPSTSTRDAASHNPQRTRRSLSVHFAPSPILTSSPEDTELATDLDNLDISGYMEIIQETATAVATEEVVPTQLAITTTKPEDDVRVEAAVSDAVTEEIKGVDQLKDAESIEAETGAAPRCVEVDAAPVDPVKVTVGKIEAVLASAKPLEGSAKSLNAVFGTTVA